MRVSNKTRGRTHSDTKVFHRGDIPETLKKDLCCSHCHLISGILISLPNDSDNDRELLLEQHARLLNELTTVGTELVL